MFDQLFKHASTRARHVTAPFAEERARYLDYCELRGDSRSLQLRKAHDLLWIARKLNSHTGLQVTSDQIRALVINGRHDRDTGGPNLNLLSTRRRLLGHACAWLRYLGYLCEPSVPIPFGSRLLEYCDWAKQQRGLTDSSIYFFRGTIRRFLRWYGPIGRQLSSIHASDIDAYLAFGSGRGWARVTIHNSCSRPAGILPLRCPRGMVSAAFGRNHPRAANLCAGETASWPHAGRCGAAFCGLGRESVHGRA